jgi:uncharacterized protein YhaN
VRLRSVEAIRYGALRGSELAPLGDGLTVVVGANEAGKSTFASLVRHTLFGFSRRSESERGYHLDADEKRAGRLVFEDDEGERWVLLRTDGPKRGTPELAGPRGESDAHAFIERVTSGVSPVVYRQVFGFGLDELADLRSLDAIQDHLYSGVTGLESNPRKALAALEERAAELYLARGRRRINELDRDLKDVRKRRRELSRATDALVADRDRLGELESRLGQRRGLLDEAVLRSEHLAVLTARAEEQSQRIEALALEIKEQGRTLATFAEAGEGVQVDEALLGDSGEIEALLARADEYEMRAAERISLEGELAQRRSEVDEQATALGQGWTGERAIAFRRDPARVGFAEDIAVRAERAELALESATNAADRSETVVEDARGELAAALRSAGMDAAAKPEEVAAERAEVDRALAASGAVPVRPWPAVLLGAVGLAVGVWGSIAGDIVTMSLGAAAAVAAIVLFAVRAKGTPAADAGDVQALLDRKGCLDVAAERAKELARLRREHQADMEEARSARERIEAISGEWDEWCRSEGLDATGGPARARETARAVVRLADEAERVDDLAQKLDRETRATESFESSARRLGVDTTTGPAQIVGAVGELGDRLAAERELHERVAERDARVERASEEIARLVDARSLSEDARSELCAEAGVTSVAHLQAELAAARQTAAGLREEVATLSAEHGELTGRLEAATRGDEQARLSLEESELTERLAAAVEEYVVAALAARLLAETLADYERDRQPDVIRRASEAFSAMTGGRYTRISTPLGEFDPSIFDASERQKGNERLSTGTAQQLYLALRLAYIQSLGERAPALPVLMDDVLVNFDDDRRERTAQLVAEFARSRQVVLFTCHESTVKDLFATADSATRLEL